MEVKGEMLIGSASVRGGAGEVRAFDPARNIEIDPPFFGGGPAEVDRACQLAAQAFDSYRNLAPELRSNFMHRAADNIVALGDVLFERLMAETGLPRERAEGEVGRAVAQLRMFADLVRDGRWRCATLDSSDPARLPRPKPDLRMQKMPIGPVAVFGSSNFPMLYSVAGGDTASALAAGCPVVVKAHGSHMGTSELVGRALQKATIDCGLHEGVFSLLIGDGNALGEALVDHPAIKAVGFTGSEGGGMALVRRGQQRPEPIPVFAEMTSVNPIFILPNALATRAEAIATGFVEQMTIGVGQMCLKPGIIVAVEGPSLDQFYSVLRRAISDKPALTMLSPNIFKNYMRRVDEQRSTEAVSVAANGASPTHALDGQAFVFECSAKDVQASMNIASEMFGPAALVIRCADKEEMLDFAKRMNGQLTATLQIDPEDMDAAHHLLTALELKTNRILVNAFSNIVDITHATVHGGPYPAASDSRFTSVGATAIDRFLRPICYQNLPQELLPPALQDGNPLSLWRLRDGQLMQA